MSFSNVAKGRSVVDGSIVGMDEAVGEAVSDEVEGSWEDKEGFRAGISPTSI